MAERSILRWFVAIAALVMSSAAFAHPFHVTLSEARVNHETHRLEVAMRVFPEDLERALEHKFARKIDIEQDEDADERIVEYLRGVFRLRDPEAIVEKEQGGEASDDNPSDPIALHWVGKEIEIRHAWLYFEIELDREIEGLELSVSAMFAVEPMQENTIQLRDGEKRVTLQCTRAKPWVFVAFEKESESPDSTGSGS